MEKIIVVEDDKDVRENIEDILSSEGYEIKIADNGLQALEILSTFFPDLIITDILMPYLDGYELIRELHKRELTSEIPVIFLTAKSDYTQIRDGMRLGAADYITKPFRYKDITDSVKVQLEKKNKQKNAILAVKDDIYNILPGDLTSILDNIKGFSQVLINKGRNIAGDELSEIALYIKLSSDRIKKHLEKFYRIVELESFLRSNNYSILKEMPKVDNMDEVIHSVVDELSVPAGREDDFFISIEEGEIGIPRYFFRMIIVEVLENSLRYSKKGTKIKVKGSTNGGNYELIIADSGNGIPPTRLEELNDPHKDCDTLKIGYTKGLGVCFIKRALNVFGGEIEFASEYKKGASILLRFGLRSKNNFRDNESNNIWQRKGAVSPN